MAGHSHAKTIKYRKGGQDAKRSKLFTKIQREIYIAVKAGGPDDKSNSKLRLAKQKARFVNMPNDKIADAVKRASEGGSTGKIYEECYYLVAFLGGLFILIKALTDNKNRSASDIRGIINSYEAQIKDPAGADYLFNNIGVIKYADSAYSFNTVFEKAIELDVIDVLENTEENEEGEINKYAEVLTEFKNFASVKSKLEESFGEAAMASTEWRPVTLLEPQKDQLRILSEVIEQLEDLDDVSAVYTNFLNIDDDSK